jgi:hypothetical protein
VGYVGGRLAPLFDRSGVDGVCRRMAEEGGRRMTAIVKQNTPIGHQPFGQGYIPGALREEIHQKLLVVRFSMAHRAMVYESGAESNLDYAPFVEEGTGLYGPYRRMYEIRPKNPNGWLSWIDQETGERIFAKRVRHPGSPGSHMFAIGAHLTEFEFHLWADRMVEVWMREQVARWEAQPRVVIGARI